MDILSELKSLHPQKLSIEKLTASSQELRPDESILLLVHAPSYLNHLRSRAIEAQAHRDHQPLVFESHTERGSSTVQPEKSSSSSKKEEARAYEALTGLSGPMDTYVSANSWDVALLAAGTVCLAVDRVLKGECSNAVCLVRPPGHHVGRDGRTSSAPSSGFCLLNNVIVGAMHARRHPGIQRVAVLDWDIHHGNGTEELMKGDPDAFFASIHLFTNCFFPGTGNDCAEPNIVNVALRNHGIGSGSTAFREGMRNQILPAMDDFAPDIIFISAGFDGHKDDIIGGMAAIKNNHVPAGYTEDDYVWATHEVLKIAHRRCSGRVVSVLEGGYDVRFETNSLAKSIAAHIDAMVIWSPPEESALSTTKIKEEVETPSIDQSMEEASTIMKVEDVVVNHPTNIEESSSSQIITNPSLEQNLVEQETNYSTQQMELNSTAPIDDETVHPFLSLNLVLNPPEDVSRQPEESPHSELSPSTTSLHHQLSSTEPSKAPSSSPSPTLSTPI